MLSASWKMKVCNMVLFLMILVKQHGQAEAVLSTVCINDMDSMLICVKPVTEHVIIHQIDDGLY